MVWTEGQAAVVESAYPTGLLVSISYLETTDDGSTWRDVTPPNLGPINGTGPQPHLQVLDRGRFRVLVDGQADVTSNVLLASDDDGATWVASTTDISFGTSSFGLIDESVGWLSSNTNCPNAGCWPLWSTSDGGVTGTPVGAPSKLEWPNAGPPVVAFEGIRFSAPDGWTVARRGRCSPAPNHTIAVTVRGELTPSCPAAGRDPASSMPPPAATSISLDRVYGPDGALSWPGSITSWNGQPAWLDERTEENVTVLTLTLPWLNASVTARSPDASEARTLLDRVGFGASSDLAVDSFPDEVSSVQIAGTGTGASVSAALHQDVVRLLPNAGLPS